VNPGQKKLYCLKALEVAALYTRTEEQDEANAEKTLAGDAPRASSTMDRDSPSTTEAAAENSSLIHSTTIHTTQSCLFILRPSGQKTHLKTMCRQPKTPK
jgi:hypothetical protein